jgi:hypothetical protein
LGMRGGGHPGIRGERSCEISSASGDDDYWLSTGVIIYIFIIVSREGRLGGPSRGGLISERGTLLLSRIDGLVPGAKTEEEETRELFGSALIALYLLRLHILSCTYSSVNIVMVLLRGWEGGREGELSSR